MLHRSNDNRSDAARSQFARKRLHDAITGRRQSALPSWIVENTVRNRNGKGWGWRGGGRERIDADEYCGILSSCFPVPDTLNTRSREKQERERERGIEREREEEKERQREKERARGTLLYFSVSN